MDYEENKNEELLPEEAESVITEEIPEERGKIKTSTAVIITAVAIIISIFMSCLGTVFIMWQGAFNPLGLSRANWQKLKWGFDVVDELYYKDVNQEKIVDGALLGISTALDEYSSYMPMENAEDFKQTVDADSYCGVGLYIYSDMEENKVRVMSAIADSPANEAGIETNDCIIAVDGKPVGGDIDLASSMMLGEEGTKVTITVVKAKTGEQVDINIKRAKIKLETVGSLMLENNIGYMEITQFGVNTYNEFVEHFNSLTQDGMEKLILDLRSNPGGYFTSAVSIAEIFLDKDDVIICTKDKNGHTDEYRASGGGVDIEEIVILCDGGTASASEVVIGALCDNGKAKLIGTKTFGKGVTQVMIDYYDGSSFKVTDTTYYTPSGECIDKKGIMPDIEIENEDGIDMQLKAAMEELS